MANSKTIQERDLINSVIVHLQMSSEFKETCQKMGFTTLAEILTVSPEDLRSRPDFSYSRLEELITLLSEYGLLNKWQPLPGNNAF